MAIVANYYVDPLTGNNSNAGTTTGAPFATWQKGLDMATAGQVIALRGQGSTTVAETVSSAVALVRSGDNISGMIKSIGTDSSWEDTGSRYVVDGASSAGNILYNNSFNTHFFKNIELRRATGAGFDQANSSTQGRLLFENCVARLNGGRGFDTYYDQLGVMFVRCGAFQNGSDGFYSDYYSEHGLVLCVAGNNGGIGFHAQRLQADACIAYSNVIGFGFDDSCYLNNSVSDGNSSHGVSGDSAGNNTSVIIGCRLTNNGGYGVQSSSPLRVFGDYNLYYNNTSGHYSTGMMFGANSVIGTSDGYVDRANKDFNLTASAELRRVGVVMPS